MPSYPTTSAEHRHIDDMIEVFASHDPDIRVNGRPGYNNRVVQTGKNNYARTSWPQIKSALQSNRRAQLYDLAIRMRKEILREEIQNPVEDSSCEELLDVYATIHTLHANFAKPRSQPINPYNDFCDFVFGYGGAQHWKCQVLSHLHAIVEDLGMPTDQAQHLLRTMCQYVGDKFDLSRRGPASEMIHAILSCGLPFDEVLPQACPQAQAVIRLHPAYVRQQLNSIVCPTAPPVSLRKPGM